MYFNVQLQLGGAYSQIIHFIIFIETKDRKENTPISIASSNGNLDIVKYLYETCHANIETKDKDGNTPISWASYFGYHEIVKYFQPTLDEEGQTPID